jgi:hypothetical protein
VSAIIIIACFGDPGPGLFALREIARCPLSAWRRQLATSPPRSDANLHCQFVAAIGLATTVASVTVNALGADIAAKPDAAL